MPLLNWTPADDHHDPAFTSLESLTHAGVRYTVAPIVDSTDVIDGWSLSRELDGTAEDLGRFGDATNAQLHAQHHHDQTTPSSHRDGLSRKSFGR